VAAVAIDVLVLRKVKWHALHISRHITMVTLVALACQCSRRRVWNPLPTTVLAEALCTRRVLCEGIKLRAFLSRDSLLTGWNLAFVPKEALVVLPEEHKAGAAAIAITSPSAVLGIAHTSLEAIVWTKRCCTMVCVAVEIFMRRIA